MDEMLLSMGLDVGTSTTQMILSRLTIENKASGFAVPQLQIAQREVLYQSPVHFTPLLGENLVDGEKIRALVEQEYRAAGVHSKQINTGAVIITGESSRKENAQAVLEALSAFAGEFVVATAGPHLESVLAAKGAGADKYAEETGLTVLHMDIGGGTSNLALLKNGQIVATGCMNVGGRLLKFGQKGQIVYCSPALRHRSELSEGAILSPSQVMKVCEEMVCALEMAAGLRPADETLARFWTREAGNPWLPPENVDAISFSGGVAACIDREMDALSFGDIGPLLGQAIKRSRLCSRAYRVASNAIRATVIGAGCHSTQLSGSTVFYRNVVLPTKNLPVVTDISRLSQLDGPEILMLPGDDGMNYQNISKLAEEIKAKWPHSPVLIALEADMAKALGHALALRLPPDWGILCIDRVKLTEGEYLDVGQPVASALPVVVKTLILSNQEEL